MAHVHSVIIRAGLRHATEQRVYAQGVGGIITDDRASAQDEGTNMTQLHRIVIVACTSLAFAGCSKSPPRPTSKSEFIAASRKAIESREPGELRKLAKWNDVPTELRDQFNDHMRMLARGKYEIKEIELVDVEPDDIVTDKYKGRPTKPNLKPRYWLKVKMLTTDGSGFEGSEFGMKLKFPVGVEDGVFKICGTVWAGPQPDESKLQPHVQIGITKRDTPFIDYPEGPGTIDYNTTHRKYTIDLKDSSGRKFGTISGTVIDPEDGPSVVTIHADVSRPVRIEILGMKAATVEPKSFNLAKLIVPVGVTKLKVTGEFEFVYEFKK